MFIFQRCVDYYYFFKRFDKSRTIWKCCSFLGISPWTPFQPLLIRRPHTCSLSQYPTPNPIPPPLTLSLATSIINKLICISASVLRRLRPYKSPHTPDDLKCIFIMIMLCSSKNLSFCRKFAESSLLFVSIVMKPSNLRIPGLGAYSTILKLKTSFPHARILRVCLWIQ